MIINPVTITMSRQEAERVWSVVDKRIKALGDNSAERRVLEEALDALGAAITAAAAAVAKREAIVGNMETTQRNRTVVARPTAKGG